MRRFFVALLLIISCFVLQTTIFQWISFGGIVPNILVILTSTYGIMRGDRTGLVIGLFCGLLVDIFFGSFLGFNGLVYMYIGYFNGKFHKVFYPEDIKLPIILFICSDLLYGFAFYVIMFMLRGRFEFSYYFSNIILPELVYTILSSLIFYPIFLLLHNWIESKENRRGMRYV